MVEKDKNGKNLIDSQFLKDNLNTLKKLKFIDLTKEDTIKVLSKIQNNKCQKK